VKNLHELDQYRRIDQKVFEFYGGFGDDKCGVFEVTYKTNKLFIIATAFDGWDHLSVSLKNRTPNWYEMKYIAKLFFKPHEVAVQYYVPEKDNVNVSDTCLHWWRPHMPHIILMPPKAFV
jgi:hypothetical protein